jgi:hypothetical protein
MVVVMMVLSVIPPKLLVIFGWQGDRVSLCTPGQYSCQSVSPRRDLGDVVKRITFLCGLGCTRLSGNLWIGIGWILDGYWMDIG